MKSTLYLVGAGPGDPELITLKAIKTLAAADVILYDALANESLLDYARPGTIKEFVGKRYGCHALSQDEINHRIIMHASSYSRVVRLKGGDPFVFGRAQEEIEAARQAGRHRSRNHTGYLQRHCSTGIQHDSADLQGYQ